MFYLSRCFHRTDSANASGRCTGQLPGFYCVPCLNCLFSHPQNYCCTCNSSMHSACSFGSVYFSSSEDLFLPHAVKRTATWNSRFRNYLTVVLSDCRTNIINIWHAQLIVNLYGNKIVKTCTLVQRRITDNLLSIVFFYLMLLMLLMLFRASIHTLLFWLLLLIDFGSVAPKQAFPCFLHKQRKRFQPPTTCCR